LETTMPLERPKEYAMRRLVHRMLDGELAPGDSLPPERELAEEIGVTRPTLREALQRLASEGWITIAQGKSTRVNDYSKRGGLGILRSIVQYSEEIPWDIVRGLLELRVLLAPPAAEEAARRAPQILLEHLSKADELEDDAEAFARFDRKLLSLVNGHSGNPILPLMFNDFSSLHESIGHRYFSFPDIRRETRDYYRRLAEALEGGRANVAGIIAEAMVRSKELVMTRLEPES
jgi:GntR family negative regulator for fad regulon and positive regulator of fabA